MNEIILNTVFEKNHKPILTVALPVYNGKKIAWIALESLCEQIDINFNWELIIYEEIHQNSVFPKLLDNYIDRLKLVGCSRILFITNNEKVTLIEKWIEIGKNVSESSKCFMLHAADCYSPKKRLKVSCEKIVDEDYDWYDQTKGYFYSFISDRVVLYDYKGLTNLNMSLKTEYIKSLPFSNLKSGIDGYIYNHSIVLCKKSNRNFRRYFDDEVYVDSIDTHGHNNISHSRESFFDTKPNIFSQTNLKISDLGWNETVKNSITTKSKYQLTIIISTYLNTEYLEDCFNSIIKSIGDKKVQVLVGIDSCVKSKEYIQSNTYPDCFEFYFFQRNNGPYTVFNSLSKIAKSDNILFFGSDDVMSENLVEECIYGLNIYDCVKLTYTNFFDGKPIDSGTKKQIGEGVFAIKKEIFDYMNGFEPWMCAADSDFMTRLYSLNKYSFNVTNGISFYRRIHQNSLTSRKDTGMKSKLRSGYVDLINKRTTLGPIDEMVVKPYMKLEVKEYKQVVVEPIENKRNVPSLMLLKNRNFENQPLINYSETKPTSTPKKKINQETEESHKGPNSLLNNSKNLDVDKKMKEQILKAKNLNSGKDFLKI